MVSVRAVNRVVNQAFSNFQSGLESRRQQLEQQRQELVNRQRQLTEAQRNLSTQSSIRGLDINAARQRRDTLSQINQAKEQISSVLGQIRDQESQISRAEDTIPGLKEQARRDVFKQASRREQALTDLQANKAVDAVEKQLQTSLPALQRDAIIQQVKAGYSPSALISAEGSFIPATTAYIQENQTRLPDIQLLSQDNLDPNLIQSSLPQPQGFLADYRSRIERGGNILFDKVVPERIQRGGVALADAFLPKSPDTGKRGGNVNILGGVGIVSQALGEELIDRPLKYLVSQIEEETKIVKVPERRFYESGTVPSEGYGNLFFREEPIKQFSLVKGLASIGSPFTFEQLGRDLFLAPAFGPGTAARQESIYEAVVDDLGNIIGYRLKKDAARFGEALSQSRLATTSQNEATLRETARELIKRNIDDPQRLKELRDFFRRSGREDLFSHLLAQEGPINLPQTNIKPQQSEDILSGAGQSLGVRDQPGNLPPVLDVSQLPQAVGGQGRSSSAFAGTGRYERTEFFSPLLRPSQRDLSLENLNLNIRQDTGQKSNQLFFQDFRQQQQNRLDTGQKSRQDTNASQSFRQPQASAFAPRLLQLFRQQQQTKQKSKQEEKRSGRPTIRLGLGPSNPILNLRPERERDKIGEFIIESKRGGRWFKLGESSSAREAFRKGINYVDKTLAASFRIKSGGKVLDLDFIPSGYRRGKKDSSILVEERSRRLSTGSEIKEIKMFKKQSKGRKNRFGL